VEKEIEALFAATGGHIQYMSVRDYFAAAAMQGLVAGANPEHSINLHGAAEWAYNMADAMLKARGA
jgi:hypothetical protein